MQYVSKLKAQKSKKSRNNLNAFLILYYIKKKKYENGFGVTSDHRHCIDQKLNNLFDFFKLQINRTITSHFCMKNCFVITIELRYEF